MTNPLTDAADATTDATDIETAANDLAPELAELGIARHPSIGAEHTHGPQYTTRVQLPKPIARDSAEMQAIPVLYLREPTAGDLRGVKLQALAESDVQALLAVLPRIARPAISKSEAERMGLANLISLQAAVASFL